MRFIKTTEAEGHVICHDIVQIIKGVNKDTIFRKGHVVCKEDIPVLLSVGKDNLYVWEKDDTMYHEDEAAQILYDMCKNDFMKPSEVKEGKIDVIADADGYFKVDIGRLLEVNSLGEMMIATRHSGFPVKKGDKLAGTRIIPLIIEKVKMEKAKRTAGTKPLLEIKPFLHKKVGIITTGNEVLYGRIKDTFGPVIREKLAEYDVDVIGQRIIGDNPRDISDGINEFLSEGANMVICTGGMSVDPDDTTPTAIKDTGAKIISYGAPVLPGAMFLMAYTKENIPIMGLPGCVMYSKRTIFDLVLPRVMSDEPVTKEWLSSLGHGGLCLACEICLFPNCGFGK
ncbi:molybdopterin-binding protein [[Clostridium] fimetarium]|uniref:Molybdopterin molybdenumtransferase n=1 Tax=[Clostridium] fimetarium TaxID=99656 RepID=A0A1I0RAY3_9FIRM|nr:molybdopterin-binding protein [[Clostridium] fimetarium]SEW37869.1 molybdenum cofactor synthesis domain-containing protein [[Clostridium] fimetarium]